jgi:hypothetical protein
LSAKVEGTRLLASDLSDDEVEVVLAAIVRGEGIDLRQGGDVVH